MPDYLAPGVYVEETSFRPKSIEGVATSTAGFIGLVRRPVGGATLVTSYGEFEGRYGTSAGFQIDPPINYLAHAARAFFSEGGQRLVISPVVPTAAKSATSAALIPGRVARVRASFPGSAGNGQVSLSLAAKRILRTRLSTCPEGSVLRINRRTPDYVVKRAGRWWDARNTRRSRRPASATVSIDLLTLTVTATDQDGATMALGELGIAQGHPHFVAEVLSSERPPVAGYPWPWFVIDGAEDLSPIDWIALASIPVGHAVREIPVGTGAGSVRGVDAVPSWADWQRAFSELEAVDEVAIVAAPGHTEFPKTSSKVTAALVATASTPRRGRFAVLDTPRNSSSSDALAFKSNVDSAFAALYYPWAVVADPVVAGGELVLPPSGFVCGVYARSDSQRGVHKAPANEPLQSVLRLERNLTAGEQEPLNASGINCLRSLPGRGLRVWGARTATSDPEWRYVNVRRFVGYLERSIELGTQWTVFEPNDEPLWASVRQVIEAYLYGCWRDGALLGAKPDQAFFVKCDRSTMTQAGLDAGRLVCLIGVAVVKPAEFVIFSIGQWTRDRP